MKFNVSVRRPKLWILWSLFGVSVVVVAIFALPFVDAAKTKKSTYAIVPLGDSITQAQTAYASYRYPLWKMLIDAEISFDFVGSLDNHREAGDPPQPDYKGRAFDKDHEGHFGWTIDHILSGRRADKRTGTGKIRDWLQHYDADIALVHLGTNDAFYRQSNESTVKELKTLMTILRQDNPRIVIFLAKLIPTKRKPGDAEAVESLNQLIPKVAEDMNTPGSPVILVDHFSGFDADEHTYDGVHPNALGEAIMAQKWFDAIQAYLD